ncbi:bifunctional deaminase-reductase domain protein [Methanoplanus limicola DSM 2279]|uniref:Bifunctional deaminase-reductase domain protein n=2 Tax=Methanoplanus limicola TaxID=2315 RepID=H1Z3K3_9EURY|nr:bifunctional deaminase-reductase domain protein [Methanoplanus limicola DSM 2279]
MIKQLYMMTMSENKIKPHVLIMSEITADGKLTLKKGASSKILMKYMDEKTDILLHKTRAEYDAIMVGSNTIRIDNSFLTVRHVEGKSPVRVIPCSLGDLPADSNVLLNDAETIVAVTKAAGPENIKYLESRGVKVVVAGDIHVDYTLLMEILARDYGIKSLMVEGGPTLNYYMLQNRLVDEIRLIHLPFIVGGYDTPSLVGGMHIDSEDEMFRLELKKHYLCGTNLVTEYDVLYR